MSAAKLPPELLERRRRYLRDLSPGERDFIDWGELRVAANGECFLNPETLIDAGGAAGEIEVRRDERGFHVTVPRDFRYEPGRIPPGKDFLPVASITLGGLSQLGALKEKIERLENKRRNDEEEPPDLAGVRK